MLYSIKRKGVNQETIALAVLITSYYYCLPLGRFSVGFFNTDFRIFDFVIFFFIIYILSTGLYQRIWFVSKIKGFFPLYLRWFSLMIALSLFFFILYSDEIEYILPTLIRVYRFTAYMFTGAAVIAIVNTKNKFNFIFFVVIFNIWLQAIIGFFQGIGLLGSFWPDYWNKMYFNMKAPVAFLSPHHKHIGVIMLTGFGITLGLIRYYSKNIFVILILILLLLVQLSVPLFAGTRTFLLGFFALVLGYLYINRGYTFVTLVSASIVAIAVLRFSSNTITEKISAKYEERISSRVEKLGYEGLYGDRTRIYAQIGDALLKHPYLLFTGAGFQNISSFINANGAHNNYLQVLMELGIVGLIVFLSFLASAHRNLLRTYWLIPSRFIKIVSSHIWVALMGILATMLVGETIWGQAAMFTLAGQLIAIFGLGVAPLFWAVQKRAGNPYAQYSDFI